MATKAELIDKAKSLGLDLDNDLDSMTNAELQKLIKGDASGDEPSKEDHTFDVSNYMVEKEFEDAKGRMYTKQVVKNEFSKGVGKCKLYAASKLGVSVERITEAYPILNGKKIDGIMVNDLIDRYGWSNGRQFNRNQLAVKYNLISIQPIDIATQKLTAIMLSENVEAAYAKYLKGKQEVFEKELRDEMTGA